MWFKKSQKKAAAVEAVGSKSKSLLGRVPGLRFFIALILTAGAAIGAVAGMKHMELRVLQGKAGPVPIAVQMRLESAPSWMPAYVGRDIAKSLLPDKANYNDPGLASKVQALAAKQPWIRKVELISKQMSADPRLGEVILKAQYRQAVAKVQADGQWAFIDVQGYRLPAEQVPRFMRLVAQGAGQAPRQEFYISQEDAPQLSPIHHIEIQGVSSAPPAVGEQWQASDIAEGLKLVEMVYAKAYASQITAVDVRNHDGRIHRQEPFLRMTARIGNGSATDIRFGRFPSVDSPCEIPNERKFQYLDSYAEDHKGFIAGRHSYLDLRYDHLIISNN